MKNKHITPILITATIGLLLLAPLGSSQADDVPNLGVTDLSVTYSEFTYAQILEMPKTIVNAPLYCDGFPVTHGDWGGVLLGYLLTQAQITPPEGGSIQFVAADGYQTAIPTNIAVHLIIAYERNGQPLAEGLRLIVPDANGVVWIAKITHITVSISGAANPPGISVGNPNNVLSKLPTPSPPAPTLKPTPTQPQPTTPESSPVNQATPTIPPTNAPQTQEPTTNPSIVNQSINAQAIIPYLVVLTLAISLTATAYVALRRKKTNSKNTLNIS